MMSAVKSPDSASLATSVAEQRSETPVRERAPLLALCVLAGAALVVSALGVDGAREGRSWGEVVYWAGLLLLIIPIAARLAGTSASRTERISLVVVAALALLATEYLIAPLGFNNHDEFGHLRETYNLVATGHLFTHNPIQAEYKYFPGIELATSAFAHFGGLSILASWRIIAASLRIMEVLALFLVIERASQSSRVASLGVLIYMCNPSFIYFDTHFSYESFALPFGLLLIQRAGGVDLRRRAAAGFLFMLLLIALAVSHHLVGYLVAGLLVLLAVCEQVWTDRTSLSARARRRMLALYAAVACAVVAAWTALAAPTTVTHYLGPVISEAASSTVGFITGSHAAEKTLFEAQNKQAAPPLEYAIGFAAVGLLLAMLVWGLWRLWRMRTLSSPLPAMLAGVAIVYPATLIFRLTLSGSETSNRASAYVYLGLGYVVAAGVFSTPGREQIEGLSIPRRLRRWLLLGFRPIVVSLVVALTLVGGVTVGTARTERLPGPYYPAVTARAATDPESVAAAEWVGGHLAPRQALFSDIVNRLLMSSYGQENTVCCYVKDQLIPELFLTPTFTPKDLKLIRLGHLRLLVVDQRLDKLSPSTHLFFERSDGGPYYKPISHAALRKFANVAALDRTFDSGNIAIYTVNEDSRPPLIAPKRAHANGRTLPHPRARARR
jgi:hypothetical protein